MVGFEYLDESAPLQMLDPVVVDRLPKKKLRAGKLGFAKADRSDFKSNRD